MYKTDSNLTFKSKKACNANLIRYLRNYFDTLETPQQWTNIRTILLTENFLQSTQLFKVIVTLCSAVTSNLFRPKVYFWLTKFIGRTSTYNNQCITSLTNQKQTVFGYNKKCEQSKIFVSYHHYLNWPHCIHALLKIFTWSIYPKTPHTLQENFNMTHPSCRYWIDTV